MNIIKSDFHYKLLFSFKQFPLEHFLDFYSVFMSGGENCSHLSAGGDVSVHGGSAAHVF